MGGTAPGTAKEVVKIKPKSRIPGNDADRGPRDPLLLRDNDWSRRRWNHGRRRWLGDWRENCEGVTCLDRPPSMSAHLGLRERAPATEHLRDDVR